eukprot:7601803-Alexandrium_andersonii.AAC.1
MVATRPQAKTLRTWFQIVSLQGTRFRTALNKLRDGWSCHPPGLVPVSYTHLTLPTICSV